jgi:ureidoglycolate hydrolase
MKFNKHLCAVRSEIEGPAAYRQAIERHEIEAIPIVATAARKGQGWWVAAATAVPLRDERATEPLEISAFSISPRAAYVDELTRHRTTLQVFLPLTGALLAVAGEGRAEEPEQPDLLRTVLIPVHPGEAIVIERGTWHTLPFAFVSDVLCLSVMHRESLDTYHDVRDVLTSGAVGVLAWTDPPL